MDRLGWPGRAGITEIWPSQTLLRHLRLAATLPIIGGYNGSQRGVCAYITPRRSRGGFNGEIEVVGLLLSRFVRFVRSSFLEGFLPMETCFRRITIFLFSFYSFLHILDHIGMKSNDEIFLVLVYFLS